MYIYQYIHIYIGPGTRVTHLGWVWNLNLSTNGVRVESLGLGAQGFSSKELQWYLAHEKPPPP